MSLRPGELNGQFKLERSFAALLLTDKITRFYLDPNGSLAVVYSLKEPGGQKPDTGSAIDFVDYHSYEYQYGTRH
jgi:hypothetical protein